MADDPTPVPDPEVEKKRAIAYALEQVRVWRDTHKYTKVDPMGCGCSICIAAQRLDDAGVK